jgi:hypothetical protein
LLFLEERAFPGLSTQRLSLCLRKPPPCGRDEKTEAGKWPALPQTYQPASPWPLASQIVWFRAWTSINEDLISVVLRDTLSKGERSLVGDNRGELVLEMRKAYQFTMREDLVAAVEEITGRTVIAFLSDNHLDPDVAIESFVLKPVPHSDPGADGAGPGVRSA